MAAYNSTYTGAQVDNVVNNALLKSEASTTYLTQANANTTYLTKNNAETTYLKKSGGELTGNVTTSAFINTNGAYGIQKWAATTTNGTISKEITLTTHGRPIFLIVSGDNNPSSSSAWHNINIYRGTTKLTQQIAESHGASWNIPFCLCYLDVVEAGTYTYKAELSIGSGTIIFGESGDVQAPQFIAFEI